MHLKPHNLLSILSHVAHGYVGNRAAVFPLQYYGWEVDAIYTTDFLNHPGYGKLKGTRASADKITELLSGLLDILDVAKHYQIILVGYCPSAQVMTAVYEELQRIFGSASRPVLVVDPVLGDNGKLYVPQDIVDVHKKFMTLGLVDLTTPNQFELEILSEMTVDSWELCKAALQVLHARYHVSNVVILSLVIDDKMYGVGYTVVGEELSMFRIPINRIECRFSGCGDFFTALLTHAFYTNGCKLSPEIVAEALAKLHYVLEDTYQTEMAKRGAPPTVNPEIKVIQSKKILGEKIGGALAVEYF